MENINTLNEKVETESSNKYVQLFREAVERIENNSLKESDGKLHTEGMLVKDILNVPLYNIRLEDVIKSQDYELHQDGKFYPGDSGSNMGWRMKDLVWFTDLDAATEVAKDVKEKGPTAYDMSKVTGDSVEYDIYVDELMLDENSESFSYIDPEELENPLDTFDSIVLDWKGSVFKA